jgi:predicted sulfurtransferase
MEQYPDGHFRGKLYVFDNRQTMASNDDIVGTCRFCSALFGVPDWLFISQRLSQEEGIFHQSESEPVIAFPRFSTRNVD